MTELNSQRDGLIKLVTKVAIKKQPNSKIVALMNSENTKSLIYLLTKLTN